MIVQHKEMSNGEPVEMVRKYTTVDTLYGNDSLEETNTVHRILRNVLSLYGVRYASFPRNGRHEIASIGAWWLKTFTALEEKELAYDTFGNYRLTNTNNNNKNKTIQSNIML